MGEPTWYNQDGAIRTVLAIFHDATLGPDAFRAWSLQVFIALLAYDCGADPDLARPLRACAWPPW